MNFNIKKLRSATVAIGLTCAMLLTACDKGFEELNVNPNAYTEPALGPLFTTSLVRVVGTGTADRNRTNIKF